MHPPCGMRNAEVAAPRRSYFLVAKIKVELCRLY
jgi:hypothetical protein